MSRTRNSAFEDLIEVASFIPWWLSVLFAVSSYFIFHYLSQISVAPYPGTDQLSGYFWQQLIKSIATLLQIIAPLIFGSGAIISAVRQWKRRSIFNQQSSLDTVRNLSWRAFELLISEAYRQKDYEVSETQDGPDGGVDLILYKDKRKIFVQCKHWKKIKVGVKEVRELNGIVAAKGAYSGILITSGIFTTDAIEFAENCSVELIDGNELIKLLPQIDNQHSDVTLEQSPFCPKCGGSMIKRTAKKGKSVGRQFWGCSTFPKCRGIINIT